MSNRVGKQNLSRKQVRYGVVGLGHIAQVAILPAFEHAAKNSKLTAFVSNDKEKIDELGKKYNIKNAWSYEDYDDCLNSGEIDAVYIALPNNMHEEFAVKAANAGIHVLCEKPMALNEDECTNMIETAQVNNVKLMIAYRLHFEKANMEAVEIIKSGKIGSPKIFNSVFTMQVREGNIRTKESMGGGPLYDIGIYCINAARYIFQSEPIEVMAFAAKSKDSRFREIDEMCNVIMRFSEERLANFTCAFGASSVSHYQVVGSEGDITLDPAYEYAEELKYKLTIDGKTKEKNFPKCDQFAPELLHFSQAILEDFEPQPSGEEGLADIRIIEAIQEAIDTGNTVKIAPAKSLSRPGKETVISRPPVEKPPLVKVQSANKD